MNKKKLLGLLLFGCSVIAALFFGATMMIRNDFGAKSNRNQLDTNQSQNNTADSSTGNTAGSDKGTTISADEEPWLSSNPSDSGLAAGSNGNASGEGSASVSSNNSKNNNSGDNSSQDSSEGGSAVASGSSTSQGGAANDTAPSGSGSIEVYGDEISGGKVGEEGSGSITASDVNGDLAGTVKEAPDRELIIDSTKVDYEAYIPSITADSIVKAALDIKNPKISVDAKAAILIDADTKKVLYYKNPTEAVFPASTAKLLTTLVALDWCSTDELVTIGSEIKLIAADSTKAYLKKGQILTVRNLLEGMLLPSGNDAAYATAAYVGRKSLNREDASADEAITEFVRLMNIKARELGATNSSFKTPDGYDAIGQYTTAYDMGMIGLAAAENDTILSISKKSSSRNTFVSGEDVTWNNTNALINRYSGRYYPYAIGLKTGTSTMAGRNLIAAAKKNGRVVLCVIMDSSSTGRWEDAIDLLDYGLK